MFKRIILYVILLNVCLVNTPAQEVITGLQSNYRILNSSEKLKVNRGLTAADTLVLPFFDDFSGTINIPRQQEMD